MAKKREEVNKSDKWNVEALFKSDELWEEELKKLSADVNSIQKYRGTLKESAENIKNLIDSEIALSRRINLLYTYAHMRNDEDGKNTKYRTFYSKAYNLYVNYDAMRSWITPEILAIDDNSMKSFINSEVLAPYKFYMEKVLRVKPHVLSESEENIISLAGNAMSTADDTFSSLSDTDLKFGEVLDSNNRPHEITHGEYNKLLTNKDRVLRERAFKQYHNKYEEFSTTFASLIYGKIKADHFYSNVKKYKTTLDAALFPKNIDTSVYTNLIKTVRENIDALHEYLAYRKEKMGVSELHLYDVYIPFIDKEEIKFTYEEAKKTLLESIKPLGDEYYSVLKRGLNEDRWVDIYENENKRSGAYSTGCYDSFPYILMNFNGTLNAARTLAHEAGHSMHSYFTHKYQSPLYGHYPIFLAEVASTFNEELFNHYLIENTNDKKTKEYLINSRLDEIRATLFRQTMFAEFELTIHQMVENGEPLTAEVLSSEYRKLNEFYFGKDVAIDKEIDIEWARIPHFYYNYYVYQYATGISAAIALYQRVIKGGEKELNDYIGFLKAGSSKYPIETLKSAGVDMSSSKPVTDSINYFRELLKELKR